MPRAYICVATMCLAVTLRDFELSFFNIFLGVSCGSFVPIPEKTTDQPGTSVWAAPQDSHPCKVLNETKKELFAFRFLN